MEYGLIKDTTIQSIADGLRAKNIIPATRDGIAQVECDHYYSENCTSPTDPTPRYIMSGLTDPIVIAELPEAHSVEFVFTVGIVTTLSPGTSLGTIKVNCGGYQPYSTNVYNNGEKTISAKIDPYYAGGPFNVSFGMPYNDNNCFGVIFDVYALDADGNRILISKPVKEVNRLTPEEIVEAVTTCPSLPPDEAFTISGDCQYKFSNSGWNWFLSDYQDKLVFKDITNAGNMFNSNTLKELPVEISLKEGCSTTNMFYNAALTKLPVVHNLASGDSMFRYCDSLTSLNGNKFHIRNTDTTVAMNELFSGCYRLRSIGDILDNIPDVFQGTSIYGLYNTFTYCYSMEELLNLPFIYSSYGSNYQFGNCFQYCTRLRRLTFRGQVVDSTKVKASTLDLSSYVGWGADNHLISNAGLTKATKITDDATYAALKNHPDAWAGDVNYSFYNHDSAVETINSLPDTSAINITNTIKFKGTSGSKTDGGAINNLTAEEIAVAAAKGWTVTLV